MLSKSAAFSGFAVDDIDAARTFYARHPRTRRRGNAMGFSNLKLASGASIFIYSKPDHEPAGFTILNFPVKDVEAAVDELNSRGVQTKIYSDDEIRSDAKGIVRGDGEGPDIAWFRDPAGNVLSVLDDS